MNLKVIEFILRNVDFLHIEFELFSGRMKRFVRSESQQWVGHTILTLPAGAEQQCDLHSY